MLNWTDPSPDFCRGAAYAFGVIAKEANALARAGIDETKEGQPAWVNAYLTIANRCNGRQLAFEKQAQQSREKPTTLKKLVAIATCNVSQWQQSKK